MRELALERASRLYEHVVHSDCDEAVLEDVVDQVIDAADAWAAAFERVVTVEAAGR